MADAEQRAHDPGEQAGLPERVHVDLPRVRPEDMTTTQAVAPPPDPEGGRDPETEFVLRNAGL
ncbi:MAG TPA: heme biosynthesis protein HemY [Ornithinibacter sp.]|nr:heme biosynthesis protein HemY [Ornithinibacter sp.]